MRRYGPCDYCESNGTKICSSFELELPADIIVFLLLRAFLMFHQTNF